MYWQFLPCRSQVRGFRSSSNMRRVGRSVLIIWMCTCWSLPLFPPLPLPAPAVVLSHCLDPLGLDRSPCYARLRANLMNVA